MSNKTEIMLITRRGKICSYYTYLLLLIISISVHGEYTAEVCYGEDVRISCSHNEVIMMTSAEYGHMTLGRCITKEDQYLGCTNDVLPLLDTFCSGKRECSFGTLNNEDLEILNTDCLDFLMRYLRLQHKCIKVLSQCRARKPTTLSADDGYISSYIANTKGCGTSRSPWIISADPGQTIQLDLIDFAASSQTSNLVSCRFVYGFILERALGINHTICGGRPREGVIYTSKTNSVEVSLVPANIRISWQFLIKYQVTGCQEIPRPFNAWYKREGNKAVIGCDNNEQKWHLTCTGKTWVGEIGNCSDKVIIVKEKVHANYTLPFTSVVIMAAIIGSAIVCAVVAVVIGVVYVNKYRMRQETKRAEVVHKTYSTIGRNVEAYYRPVTLDQSVNSGAGWDMTLPPDPRDQTSSYPDQCTCATLQMRNHGDGDKTIRGASLERQSLYSSIKST